MPGSVGRARPGTKLGPFGLAARRKRRTASQTAAGAEEVEELHSDPRDGMDDADDFADGAVAAALSYGNAVPLSGFPLVGTAAAAP